MTYTITTRIIALKKPKSDNAVLFIDAWLSSNVAATRTNSQK